MQSIGKINKLQNYLNENQVSERLGVSVNLLRKHRDKPSLEIIEQLGGSDATERAIAAALAWLSRHQEPDGHWDTKKHDPQNTSH